jgi:hypothetical protein
MKKLIALAVLVLTIAAIGRSWYVAKDGFHIARIRTAFPIFENAPIDPDHLAIFDQPFKYVGRGRQCYAFASQDDKYILKLPRLDRYEIPFYARATFPHLWDALLLDHTSRLNFITKSFQIAGNEMKEETGTLYLHLNQSDHLKKTVQLTDRIGRKYNIDLDTSAFILQEKKPIMLPLFKQAVADGNIDQAKEILTAFIAAVESRARKGILNKDASFRRNYGYDGNKCIQIDIGSFYYKPALTSQESFERSFRETTGAVQIWLNENNPEIATWFEAKCQEIK